MGASRETPARPLVPSRKLLPAPFAWIGIPGGSGTLKTSDPNVTLSIPTERYWIAKYPITNAQYAKFVEAGGYTMERWWTAAGGNNEARTSGRNRDTGGTQNGMARSSRLSACRGTKRSLSAGG
ncbi:MAG: SUMF1/EgtB/PvdO family nonheme iron enzyme [Chloroflexi bacterium]|nr:SUMF1/EgtB/PvdO family nonheme iron enzyme [Chloroflexota bacterium]